MLKTTFIYYLSWFIPTNSKRFYLGHSMMLFSHIFSAMSFPNSPFLSSSIFSCFSLLTFFLFPENLCWNDAFNTGDFPGLTGMPKGKKENVTTWISNNNVHWTHFWYKILCSRKQKYLLHNIEWFCYTTSCVLITTRMMKMPLMIKINGKKLLELLELASYA